MLSERWNAGLNENESKIIVEKILHYINSLNIIAGKNEELKMIVEKIIKHIKVESNFAKKRNIMLKDGRIVGINTYVGMIGERKEIRNDAYASIFISSEESMLGFRYPFLYYSDILLESYISKTGHYYYSTHICKDNDCNRFKCYCSAPATSLKYTAIYTKYKQYSTIEVVDLEEVAKNTKVDDILKNKNYAVWLVFNEDSYWEIYDKFSELSLFDGYNLSEAEKIVSEYYNGNKSLAKEVARIIINYSKIFRPYRVCFETRIWSQIDCSKIKL